MVEKVFLTVDGQLRGVGGGSRGVGGGASVVTPVDKLQLVDDEGRGVLVVGPEGHPVQAQAVALALREKSLQSTIAQLVEHPSTNLQVPGLCVIVWCQRHLTLKV